MNKKLVICPACGSKKTTRFVKEGSDRLTLGEEFYFDDIYYKCDLCGEEGDFLAEADENYLNSQKKAQIALVKKILGDLNETGIAMAMFERVFELPARTLTRWKAGDFSSSAIAILRIIATYPWILQVAEHRFEPSFASCAVIEAAFKIFLQETKRNFSMGSCFQNGSVMLVIDQDNSNYSASPKLEPTYEKYQRVGG